MTDQVAEFKTWHEINKFAGIHVVATEKIHGSNGQILVTTRPDGSLCATAGSRTRWLDAVSGPDNFGFAAFVRANEAEICEKLGEGRHYGEWVGPGVNSDYGLKDKHFVLFDVKRFSSERVAATGLPERFAVVPILYDGPYNSDAINKVFEDLRAGGSVFRPGFLRPEGMVLFFPQFGSRLKMVFKPEKTGWARPAKKSSGPKIDFLDTARPFLQPVRLEKLLMRDENYQTGYPQNLPEIAKAYLADLIKETPEISEIGLQAVKKTVFPFIREEAEKFFSTVGAKKG